MSRVADFCPKCKFYFPGECMKLGCQDRYCECDGCNAGEGVLFSKLSEKNTPSQSIVKVDPEGSSLKGNSEPVNELIQEISKALIWHSENLELKAIQMKIFVDNVGKERWDPYHKTTIPFKKPTKKQLEGVKTALIWVANHITECNQRGVFKKYKEGSQ